MLSLKHNPDHWNTIQLDLSDLVNIPSNSEIHANIENWMVNFNLETTLYTCNIVGV